MKIQGICYIANKYQSQDKDFTRKERFAFGRITWQDNVKDKFGTVTKSYTSKGFTCFDINTIDILDGCKRDLLVIEGQLRTEHYTSKEGEKRNKEVVIINKAKIYDKDTPSSSQEEKKEFVDNLDDIPF